MAIQLQCIVISPAGHAECGEALLEAAQDLDARLKGCGAGFFLEVRELQRDTVLFHVVDPGRLAAGGGDPEPGGPPAAGVPRR